MPIAPGLPFARSPLAAADADLLRRLERNIAELEAEAPRPLSARGQILARLIERRQRLLQRVRVRGAAAGDGG